MILQGHILDKLPEIASESVHCVVTSPPYWGLRDYGLEPQVWDGVEGCGHVWGEIQGQTTTQWAKGVGQKGDTLNDAEKRAEKRISQPPIQGQFCQNCNAWRGSLGLEPTPELYLQHMVEVFREVRRVMRPDATCWLNIGDSYARSGGEQGGGNRELLHMEGRQRRMTEIPMGFSLKPKDLCGIPWRLALALQADGWWLRSDIIWAKPNPMPESVTDRPTRAHEYIFLLTKAARYFYDTEAVREPSLDTAGVAYIDGDGSKHYREPWEDNKKRDPKTDLASWACKYGSSTHPGGRNLRSVWNIATQPFPEAHFATFPEKLVQRCIMAGTSERGACSCGAPWERVVEKEKSNPRPHKLHKGKIKEAADGKHPEVGLGGGFARTGEQFEWKVNTIGWRPTCECGGEPVPCVVLDPFLGSGTVGKVAQALGRDWIGIELNPNYCEMAENRTIHRQELLRLG